MNYPVYSCPMCKTILTKDTVEDPTAEYRKIAKHIVLLVYEHLQDMGDIPDEDAAQMLQECFDSEMFRFIEDEFITLSGE